jgi:hypothetical protein
MNTFGEYVTVVADIAFLPANLPFADANGPWTCIVSHGLDRHARYAPGCRARPCEPCHGHGERAMNPL